MREGWILRGMLAAGAMAVALGLAQPLAADEAPPPPKDFGAFLADVEAEAAAKGIRPETLAALHGVRPIDRIIELDRKQPEFTVTFAQYLGRVVSPQKVAQGRRMLAENRALLAQIEKRYGVQPRFVVALWGIESDYGRLTGNYPVITALATLAWDGRRSAYFRGELMNALEIVDKGNIGADAMIGSWAGAMGQCQFMPSTFLKYAQDFDGDGRRDIWSDRGDVLASAANYLAGLGWKDDETWGRAVTLPRHFDKALANLKVKKTLAEWSRLGVRSADGKPLPRRALEASIVFAEDGGPAFLVYDDFRAVMKWNHSTFFALAAGHLADRIARR
ncbi:MAG: lytic murein transglycosylase [Magnetospirillum sp.]|nr:lytic murein transglycosylase [Magnetospirillum sp.]